MAKKHSYKSLSAAGTQLRWLDCLIRLCLFTRVAKLAAYAEEVSTSTGFGSEEWGSGWRGGTNFLVEVEETAAMSPPPSATRRGSNNNSSSTSNSNGTSEDYNIELGSQEQVLPDATGSTIAGTTNGTTIDTGPKIIVRTEEVLIVGLVLILWVGAIMLFFNRWGKIRMLEPYQPKFQQQHRSSCPLVDLDAVQAHQRASVSRMSMGMVHQHNLNMPTCQFAAYNPSLYAKGYASHVSHVSRPRQNSVFVGATTSHYLMPRPPRKTRSAMDLHSMVLDESAEQV